MISKVTCPANTQNGFNKPNTNPQISFGLLRYFDSSPFRIKNVDFTVNSQEENSQLDWLLKMVDKKKFKFKECVNKKYGSAKVRFIFESPRKKTLSVTPDTGIDRDIIELLSKSKKRGYEITNRNMDSRTLEKFNLLLDKLYKVAGVGRKSKL